MKRINLQNHKVISLILLLGWIFLSGLSIFPIKLSSLDFGRLFLAISWYGLISICFTGLFGKEHTIRVFILILVFTALGLLCRYLLNYGEVSNSVDFTIINVLVYISIVPLFCIGIYWCINKLGHVEKK
ncbi:hypothetical protein H8S10_11900 [Clostridium sp. NSJ-49]|uniref:hypothetical protein n=1 Tax=Clostridium TaxID=1485 RepID=UPI00164C8368|nr:hypothetical protein [Clostridium sp. NSJ-49]MBC5626160.1 hypothetical protein [Clostridium sp. NSJ-49]